MKNISSLLIAFSILFATVSCGKKDAPQPTNQNTGSNGGTSGTTTLSKTVNFFQMTSETDPYPVYISKNQTDLGSSSSLIGTLYGVFSTRQTTNACDNDSNTKKLLTEAVRYYYQIKRGTVSSAPVVFEGYFDIAANGNITFTQTIKPSTGSGIIYNNCSSTKGAFTIYYR